MNRIAWFHSFIFASLLILASCGSDNSLSGKTASNSNSLTGAECACNSAYAPVCGVNSSGNNTSYDNQCIASCYKAQNVIQGNCECQEIPVCVTGGEPTTECEARFFHKTIRYYGTCRN